MRIRTRTWLRQHPRTRRFLSRTGSLDVDEFTLARGVAAGLFIALTPTVGVQTLLMLGVSMVLRANFPAAFIVSWISNPLTVAPLYYLFYQLGGYLMRFLPVRFESLSGIEAELAVDTYALILGSLAVAVPLALSGYFVFLYVWRRFDLHLPRRVEVPE
ncbi:MAG: DUF2062 domain-containing protein [Pseudomonadales bacterium]